MNLERPLYEYESFLRHSPNRRHQGPVNMALGDPRKSFDLHPFTSNETYVIPSLKLTIAGPRLLRNYQQFGQSLGELRIEQLITDELGVYWDRLSGGREFVGTAADWPRGVFEGTRSVVMLTDPDKPIEEGRLVPDVKAALSLLPYPDIGAEILPVGPPIALSGQTIAWKSAPVSIDGAKLIHVAWEIQDAVDKHYIEQRKYRIDIQFLRRSTMLNKTFCLTHWDGVGNIPPDPLPLVAPPAAGPLGTPIPSVFRTQARSIEGLNEDAESVCIMIYFDITDSSVGNPRHVEDLLRRPPIAIRAGFYTRFYPHYQAGQVYDPNTGRRECGVFRSFRELLEFSGNLIDGSAPGAFNGDDIAFLSLPISSRLRGRTGDKLAATFDGQGSSGLSLLEIRAVDGFITYEEV